MSAVKDTLGKLDDGLSRAYIDFNELARGQEPGSHLEDVADRVRVNLEQAMDALKDILELEESDTRF